MKADGQVDGQVPRSAWQLYFVHSNLSFSEPETSVIVLTAKPRE